MIPPFFLHRPTSVEEASGLLAEHGEEAKILAGGSELVLLFKMGLAATKHVIDIKAIAGINRIEFHEEARLLSVGALATHRMLETSDVVRKKFPILARMERSVANVRIRNVGTLAGNLCFAEPHADPGALLLALDASVVARSDRGERTLKMADFFVSDYQTALGPKEILTKIKIPRPADNFSGAYLRFCPGERPMAGVALILRRNDGVCQELRLALGCVEGKPIRIHEVEASVAGKALDEISARALEYGEKASLRCNPDRDIWGSVEYKRQIVKTLVSRGLKELCQ